MKTASSEMLENLGTAMWSGTTVPAAAPVFAEQSPKPVAQRLSLAAQRHMTRLTIDISIDLHRRMKRECAGQGLKMVDVLREFMETRFPG
jgi:hypothetical protein